MAKPIKETPVLKGKDARRFIEGTREVKSEPAKIIQRAKHTFDKFQKIAAFSL